MQEKYYSKVDETPLKVWRKCNEGHFHFLRIDHNVGTKEDDIQAWTVLYNDWIEQVGLTPEFKEYLDLLEEKIEAQFEYLESKKDGIRNRFLLNRIKILTAQISDFEKSGGKGLTIFEVLLRLGRMQGYPIKENDTTILEYFTLLKNYNEDGRSKD